MHKNNMKKVTEFRFAFIVILITGAILLAVVRLAVNGDQQDPDLDHITSEGDRSKLLEGEGELTHLSSKLLEFYTYWKENSQEAIPLAIQEGLEIEESRIKVLIILFDEQYAENAMRFVTEQGGEVINQFQMWIDAWVPISSFEALGRIPSLSVVQEPIQVMPLGE